MSHDDTIADLDKQISERQTRIDIIDKQLQLPT